MSRGSSGLALFLSVLVVLCGDRAVPAQEPAAAQSVSEAELRAAIDKLGDLDYDTRTAASRTVRRTAASQAIAREGGCSAAAEGESGIVRELSGKRDAALQRLKALNARHDAREKALARLRAAAAEVRSRPHCLRTAALILSMTARTVLSGTRRSASEPR